MPYLPQPTLLVAAAVCAALVLSDAALAQAPAEELAAPVSAEPGGRPGQAHAPIYQGRDALAGGTDGRVAAPSQRRSFDLLGPGVPGAGDIAVLGSVSFEANPRTDQLVEEEVIVQYRYAGPGPVCLAVWSEDVPRWTTTVEAVGGVLPLPDPGVLSPWGAARPEARLSPTPACLVMIPAGGRGNARRGGGVRGGEVAVRFRLALDPFSPAGTTDAKIYYGFRPL